jgi:CTP synthase
MGGTMRLGNYETVIDKTSNVYKLYNTIITYERHRHRYEVNNKYIDDLQNNGLSFVGKSKDNKLMEIIEISDHPFFVGCQFHPEYRSRFYKPHPLFIGLLKAMIN